MFNDYTVVLGVDQRHYELFKLILKNWKVCKPSLFNQQFLVFYDRSQLEQGHIEQVISDGQYTNIQTCPWPMREDVVFDGIGGNRWKCPQRHKMLSGFVHIPAYYVKTNYWLKLDLDAVANGFDDWVKKGWFEEVPAIVAPPWGYTKPGDQMDILDEWFDRHMEELAVNPKLALERTSVKLVKHQRIISWCSFFNTKFTETCASKAEKFCGYNQIPVPSQDGYMWYMAYRLGWPIKHISMKYHGWIHRKNEATVKEEIHGIELTKQKLLREGIS